MLPTLPRSLSTYVLLLPVLLCGCVAPSQTTRVVPPEAVFVVLGDEGVAWARAITRSNHCPNIEVDGLSQPMAVRVGPGTAPLRPTVSTPQDSIPAAFPVLTCEFRLAATTQHARIGSQDLPLPKANPTRLVMLGDTGCRMKKSEKAWQACLDTEKWPMEKIAGHAAAFKPDLVLHVGDYHYRENACDPSEPGCKGSPWGYGWDTWEADLFVPARRLFAAAPWVMTRGNHEECRRAGQGWFRFIDPRPWEETRSCDLPANDALANISMPWAVPLGKDTQLLVFDSALASNSPLDPTVAKDAVAFNGFQRALIRLDELAARPGVGSFFVAHHPVLGFSPKKREHGVYGGNLSLQSVMKTLHSTRYYPDGVRLGLFGHVHLLQAINFKSDHPATLVSGTGGDKVEANLPAVFPRDAKAAEGVELDTITHSNRFGFLVLDRLAGTDWQVRAFDHHASLMTTCVLRARKLSCDRTGWIE